VRSIVSDPSLTFDDVRIGYTDLMRETAARRASLRRNFFFECKCEACETDPAGLDKLKRGSMRCPRSVLLLLPDGPDQVLCGNGAI
jgi:hypothetical protein